MRVDFYQLAGEDPKAILAAIAGKLLATGERLLVVADDPALLAKVGRSLWEEGGASFLAHAMEGGSDDQRQPILLSTGEVAANRARNIALIDGKWRDAALHFDRAFLIFDAADAETARGAWRKLLQGGKAELHYWERADGRWEQKA